MFIDTENSARHQVLDLLRSQVVTVTFTKKNGDQRVMRCTLSPEYFAQDKYKTTLTEDSNSEKSNCTVWDVDAQAWRSFLWANLTHIDHISGDTP